MNITDIDVRRDIYDILKSRFDMHLGSLGENADTLHFLGHQIHMRARDMVYLLYILEQRIGIRFTADDIDNEALYTVSGLTGVIMGRIG